ncbi:N-acetyl-gamma-glutamyl-phosphate reductase [Geoglobus ahangari]|uniref:N-acetyl-gamma-glutamyl-phosphate reductase n=1 Tax=Geoglobus ahangari TaxID=113653 RepID=A0A0F7IFH9_9EURY|nr:N-acetyl-gamma-glutamyl-phosphate reductase [Geoglobus ahangari]AKG91865.1 N-acetyl-gamma-glutamyl-phosphate reductase [Geoglobus ahangari]
MVRVGIIGGTGYTGSELLRILARHPEAEIAAVSSRKEKGKKLWEVHPHLKGFYDLEFVEPDFAVFSECDVVFTAVPHGEAMKYVPELYEAGVRVVDLSADYRLSKEKYEEVYGKEHEAYIDAVYGLTELHRDEIRGAKLVANPGCYPTGAILAVAPLADLELVERVVFDSKSGITGAGASPTEFTHYPNLHEAIVPYKITEHRHYHEMEQELRRFQEDIRVSFTPQVFPGSRGILTNAHVFLRGELEQDELEEIYRKFYDGCYFIRMQRSVRLSYVRGSNFVDISVHKGRDRVVVVSAIDNLVKGASGQAVQNMNVMLGLDERLGLDYPPLFP